MFTVVPESAGDDDVRTGGVQLGESSSVIDDIVREGARRLLAEALGAEVEEYIARFAGERDEAGRRLVVRNGYHEPREVITSSGAVEVQAPRVNDKRIDPDTGERARFSSPDPAAVVPQDPEDQRGVAAAVLAWVVLGGLRARAGAVPRLVGGTVGLGDHEADRDLAWRGACVRRSRSVRCGLRLLVGRRHSRQHPPGGTEAVPAGHDRRPR